MIGRLVCFRDPFSLRPPGRGGRRNRVVQTPDGGQYSGYGGFTNFADPAVRKYNIDIAVRARGRGRRALRLRPTTRRPASEHGLPGAARHSGALDRRVHPRDAARARALRDVPRPRSSASLRPGRSRSRRTSSPWRESRTTSRRCSIPRTGAGEYNVADLESQPYEIVLRSLRDFAGRRGTGARVVPWLQDSPSASRTAKRRCVPNRGRAARWIDEFILWDPTVTATSEALDPNAKATKRGLAQPHEGEPIRAHAQGEPEGQARGLGTSEGHCRPPSERARRDTRAHAPRDPPRPGRRLRPDPEEFRTELERL